MKKSNQIDEQINGVGEASKEQALVFLRKANDILSVYEGNTNKLKRQLFESLSWAADGGGTESLNFPDIIRAHQLVNELIDALDPLLDKNEVALDSYEYRSAKA